MSRKFRPPTDVRTWWCAPHCGPGTLDSSGVCECGRTRFDCALAVTGAIKAGPLVEDPQGLVPTECFVSGFWCPGCGRFWANDSCMELFGAEYMASDGARLGYDGKTRGVSCVCGHHLFTTTPDLE